jgi:transmembrane protein 17
MMVIFEIIRLYLGYVGNLSERVPELTGFWLLTLMVEIPLSTFLTVIVWIPLGGSSSSTTTTTTTTKSLTIALFIPMQFALQLIHTIFVYIQVVLGFFALRLLARYQISRFYLRVI